MQAVGPQEAVLFQVQEDQDKTLSVDMSQQMWDYRNNNVFNGIPVSQQARDLNVKDIQELQKALIIHTDVTVWTGYISPQSDDRQAVKQYQEIRQKQALGTVQVFSQDRQFCPGLNKFLVLITYASLSYDLNPRYEYLKQEQA